MLLGGAKDERFSYFHSSCQLGLNLLGMKMVRPKLILRAKIMICWRNFALFLVFAKIVEEKKFWPPENKKTFFFQSTNTTDEQKFN